MKMTFLSLHHLIFSTVYVHLCVYVCKGVCLYEQSRHMDLCVCTRTCECPLIEDVKGGCPRSN